MLAVTAYSVHPLFFALRSSGMRRVKIQTKKTRTGMTPTIDRESVNDERNTVSEI
jgi:hypothetical protein